MKMRIRILVLFFIYSFILLGTEFEWINNNFGIDLKIGLTKFHSKKIYFKPLNGRYLLKGYNLEKIVRIEDFLEFFYINGKIMYEGLLYERIDLEKIDVIAVGKLSKNEKTYSRYRGSFIVIPYKKNIMVVNKIRAEEYLYSVVPSEIGVSFPDEAIKAQAVAARTYLYYNLLNRKYEKFDMLDDTSSQMYLGFDKENLYINNLINATENEIILYNDEPINALYHSTSGGFTTNNESVWGGEPIPYLRGVNDGDNGKNSSRNYWRYNISKKEISKKFGFEVTSIKIYEKGGIRAKRVLIQGKNESKIIDGNEFRRILGYSNVFSTIFSIKSSRDYFYIEGRGSGHGVGLAQWGAYGLAKKGKNYKEILKFYYRGVEVKRIANFNKYAIINIGN